MSGTIVVTRRGRVAPLAVAVTVLAAAVAVAAVVAAADDDQDVAADPQLVRMAGGSEVAAAVTLADWAAAADYLVTARVTDEERVPFPRSSSTQQFTGRRVSVDVQVAHWRADDVVAELPDVFEMDAAGWASTPDEGEVALAVEGSSRLEVGHTYLLALAWKRAECDEGDPMIPAGWTVIGSGGSLPADGGVLGQGEFEGSEVKPDSKRLSRQPESVTAKFSGQKAQDVASGIQGVSVKRHHIFQKMGGSCAG